MASAMDGRPPIPHRHRPPGVADVPVKIGDPYTVGGVTYTPADIPDYDDVGYASWYGEELAGRPTANGETFDPAAITAAHKTLPLPSYVEVTALDTGRTILVRVNDRGPMVGDRLIDLSRGAAEQLGLTDAVAAVRVRRTNPPVAERAQLRAGKPVPERIGTPESLLSILRSKAKALPVPKSAAPIAAQPAAPVASGKAKPGDDRFVVEGPGTTKAPPSPHRQQSRRLRRNPRQRRPSPLPRSLANMSCRSALSAAKRAPMPPRNRSAAMSSKAGNLWRVRVGPFASEAEASGALGKAKAKGFRDAVVQRDR
jgi:rare lipoprotein A